MISARRSSPGSANRLATVGSTGTGESQGRQRARRTTRRTAWRASSLPGRSALLTATASASSSMLILSSWLSAPYSAVMTYSEKSLTSTIPALP